MIVTVISVPGAALRLCVEADTTTSLPAFREPVATVVLPTFKVIAPAVPLKPPPLNSNDLSVWLELKVVVNVTLVAGFEPEPN